MVLNKWINVESQKNCFFINGLMLNLNNIKAFPPSPQRGHWSSAPPWCKLEEEEKHRLPKDGQARGGREATDYLRIAVRSASHNLICERSTRTAIGARAFGAIAPKVWHDLPDSIRSSSSLSSFKTHLKTHLFNQAFNPEHSTQ